MNPKPNQSLLQMRRLRQVSVMCLCSSVLYRIHGHFPISQGQTIMAFEEINDSEALSHWTHQQPGFC